jgi:hypothetical protein
MSSVLIQRQWSGRDVFWTGSGWTERRYEARIYEDATACPKTLPLGGNSKAVRRLARYWAGQVCWATIEIAE